MTNPAAEEPVNPPPRPRALIAIIGSAALAVGAMLVIFAIGIRDVPGYPAVAEQPTPPLNGRLAYVRWEDPGDGRFGGPCLYVQDIGGDERVISCGENQTIPDQSSADQPVPLDPEISPEWLSWDDEGNLQVGSYGRDGITIATIDVDRGEEIGRVDLGETALPPDRTERADGARVGTTWHDDGWAEVWVREPDQPAQTLFRDRGPDDYAFWNAVWSPLGDYVLVFDSEQRVIVIAAAGDPAPRELLRDADGVAWYQPG